MIFKIIAFIAAAIPIVLFIRAIFFKRSTRINESVKEFKKQANAKLCTCVSRAFGGGLVIDTGYRPD